MGSNRKPSHTLERMAGLSISVTERVYEVIVADREQPPYYVKTDWLARRQRLEPEPVR